MKKSAKKTTIMKKSAKKTTIMKKSAKKTTRVLTVGNQVLIRAVTMYYTGRIIYIDKDVIELDTAAWIADTGRFSQALKDGIVNECEPYPGVAAIGRGAIVDVTVWMGALPTAVK